MFNWYTHFDILTCQFWLQVMEGPLILLHFFGNFHTLLLTIHVWIVVSPPKFHWLYITNQYEYVKMSDVTSSYGMYLNFITFFCNFCTKLMNIHVWSVAYRPNFCGLFDKFILIFWYARCNYKLVKVFWLNWLFGNLNVWCVTLHQAFINFVASLWK